MTRNRKQQIGDALFLVVAAFFSVALVVFYFNPPEGFLTSRIW